MAKLGSIRFMLENVPKNGIQTHKTVRNVGVNLYRWNQIEHWCGFYVNLEVDEQIENLLEILYASSSLSAKNRLPVLFSFQKSTPILSKLLAKDTSYPRPSHAWAQSIALQQHPPGLFKRR